MKKCVDLCREMWYIISMRETTKPNEMTEHLNQRIDIKLLRRMTAARKRAYGVSQSQFVRLAIRMYCEHVENRFRIEEK